jgi:uncharacterized repeat protein (TIGR01451 family)
MMPGGTVDRAVTLDGSAATIGGKPVVLTGSVTVGATGALTIAAGTSVRLPVSGEINVANGGTLIANGSAAAPVVLVSDAATPRPGDWYYLRALAGSHLRLSNVDLSAAGRGNYPALQIQTTDAALSNCRVHGNAYDGVQTSGEARPTLVTNLISGNAFGVRNSNATSWIDARFTWWGDPSGPYHATLNPNGKGNAVSDRVLFVPWLEDEAGTVSGQVVVQAVGPSRVSPGETADIAVSVYAGSPVSHAVLILALPSAAEYVDSTAAGTYWPERHQVFWRLGDLATGDETVVGLRARYAWGLPNNYEDGSMALVAGQDFNPAELDVDSYWSYTPPEVESETPLSDGEFLAERGRNAALGALLASASAAGFVAPSARHLVLSGGVEVGVVALARADAAQFIVWDGSGALSFTYDRDAFRIADAHGGMAIDWRTFAPAFTGAWPQGISALAVPPAGFWYGDCMYNCSIRSLYDAENDKLLDIVNNSTECRECFAYSVPSQCKKCSEKLDPIGPFAPRSGKRKTTYMYKQCHDACRDPVKRLDRACLPTDRIERCQSFAKPHPLNPVGAGYDVFFCDELTGRLFRSSLPRFCGMRQKCTPGVFGKIKCYECTPAPAPAPVGPSAEAPPAGAVAADSPDVRACRTMAAAAGGCAVLPTTVRLARDPNEKLGIAGDVLPGQELRYTVTYENEGAGRAYGVYIEDTLDEALDEATLAVAAGGTYYPVVRKIVWTIGELAAKGEPGSKGEVSFSVRLRSGLTGGTVVANRAVVYFPSVPGVAASSAVV